MTDIESKKDEMKLLAMQGRYGAIEMAFGAKNSNKCFKWFRSKVAQFLKTRDSLGVLPAEATDFMLWYMDHVGTQDLALDDVISRHNTHMASQTQTVHETAETGADTLATPGMVESSEVLDWYKYPRGAPPPSPPPTATSAVEDERQQPLESTHLTPVVQPDTQLDSQPTQQPCDLPHEEVGNEAPTSALLDASMALGPLDMIAAAESEAQWTKNDDDADVDSDADGNELIDTTSSGACTPPPDMATVAAASTAAPDTPATPATRGFVPPAKASASKKPLKASPSKTDKGKTSKAIKASKSNTSRTPGKIKSSKGAITKSKSKSESGEDTMLRKKTSFMLFCEDMRHVLKQEHPGLSVPDTGRELGVRWKALSDDERTTYKEKADASAPVPSKKHSKSKTSKKLKKVAVKERSGGSRSSGRKVKTVDYADSLRERDERRKRSRLVESGFGDMHTYPMQLPDPERLHSGIPDDGVVTGIKQSDLGRDEDLKGTVFVSHDEASAPDDSAVLVEGVEVVLVTRTYLEFVTNLPADVGDAAAHAEDELSAVLDKGSEVLRGTVDMVGEPIGDGCHAVDITFEGNEDSTTVIYQERASSTTDEFLVNAEHYDASLDMHWLVVNAPVRKLFRNADGSYEWMEGIVYYIAPDMESNPWESVRVAWVDKEEETCRWHYAFEQCYNQVSPWELELSAYVLPENIADIKGPELPAALLVLPFSARDIVDHIRSFDFAWPFMLDLTQIDEYTSAFPNEAYQLDLLKLTQRTETDLYWPPSAIEGDKLLALFANLKAMCAHGKQFNKGNESFQTWCCIDMVEMSVHDLERRLLAAHPGKAERGGLEVLRPAVNAWLSQRIASRKAVDETL